MLSIPINVGMGGVRVEDDCEDTVIKEETS